MTIDHQPLSDSKKFGTFVGKTPEEIALENPAAVVRLYQKFGTEFCSNALYRDCLNDIENERESYE